MAAVGRPGGAVVAIRRGREPHRLSGADQLHVDVEVVLARSVPRERDLAAIRRQTGIVFGAGVGRERRGNRLRVFAWRERAGPKDRQIRPCHKRRRDERGREEPQRTRARAGDGRPGHGLGGNSGFGGRGVRARGDLRREAIPVLRHRFDPLDRAVAKSLSQGRDLIREVGFLDEGVGPEGRHQLLFRERPAGVLNQQHEQVERLGRERHAVARTRQYALTGVQAARPELVDVTRGAEHGSAVA